MNLPKDLLHNCLIFLKEIDTQNVTNAIPYQNVLKFIHYFYRAYHYDSKDPHFSISNYEKRWLKISDIINSQLDELVYNDIVTKYNNLSNIYVCIKQKDPDINKINLKCNNFLQELMTSMLLLNVNIKSKSAIKNKLNYIYDNLLNSYFPNEDSEESDSEESDNIQIINSETDKSVKYAINHKLKTCSCKGFAYTKYCKHIKKYIK